MSLEQFIVMNSHKTLQYSHLTPAQNKEKKTTHNEIDNKKENEQEKAIKAHSSKNNYFAKKYGEKLLVLDRQAW